MATMLGFKRYFSNTAWLVGGRVVKAVINFTIGVFIARYLGPERFGVLSYAIGLALFFTVFCTMGLDSVLVRELVGADKRRQSALMGSALILRLTGSAAAIVMMVTFLAVTRPDWETWSLALVCSLSFLFLPSDIFRAFFEAEVQGKHIITVELAQSILSGALKIYLIAVEGSVFWFSVAWLSEWALLATGLSVMYCIRAGPFSAWKVDLPVLKHLLRESAPLLLSGMTITVYQQIDRIMLKNMLPADPDLQVGFYTAALRILPFAILIPRMLGKALVPSLVATRQHTPTQYTQRAQLFLDLMTWTGVGLSALLFLGSNLIMAMYGQDYADAVVLLRIASWKGAFAAMGLASGLLIVVEGLQKWAVLRNLAGCGLNILLNLLWIPTWEAAGSAWATVLSFFVASFLVHLFIPSYRHLFWLQASSLAGGPVRLVRWALQARTAL